MEELKDFVTVFQSQIKEIRTGSLAIMQDCIEDELQGRGY